MSHPRPPSVDRLARELAADTELRDIPFPLLIDAARFGIRQDPAAALEAARHEARRQSRTLLRDVINATGVLLHTNLGRAPLPRTQHGGPVRASNLEVSLETGQRGSRRDRTGPLLAHLCGTEAALVVNNCAAALVLVLSSLARGRAVLVSRGELVEIGGGFRIPEVMEQSGARLVEVGSTNRTRLGDYQRANAANFDVALALKVHTSNYRVTGFVEETSIEQLCTLGVPVVADVGSGLLDRSTPWLADESGRTPSLPWLAQEPSVREALDAGADVVLFSCDKLLGGPQGGAIVGPATMIDLIASHPLARALRPGGLVIGALQATLLAYLRRDVHALPFWEQASRPVALLERRARAISLSVAAPWCTAAPCESVPGGGTLPGVTIPSFGLRLSGDRVRCLRERAVPIIARASGGSTVLDLRTVDPADDALLGTAIAESTADTRTKAEPNLHDAG